MGTFGESLLMGVSGLPMAGGQMGLNAVGDLITGFISNKYNKEAEERAWERTNAMYNKQLYHNSPEYRVKQLEDAGLSIGMMYGGNGASGIGGAPNGNMSAASGTNTKGMPVNMMDIAAKTAEIENIKADTNLKNKQAGKTEGETETINQQKGCQFDDCSNNEHHYYPDVQHAHDCSCDDCASHIELQEMPQRFDAFAGQDRDEFVDKTAEMTGRHNMVPFAEHADYTVYKNKNGSGFIAYDKDGKQLAVLSGYVSDNAVHGVPNVFVEEAIASKTGTKGVIYTIFTDLLNAGYKILSDELHSDDAIAFWSKLISSHQVYVVGDGEVLARANTQKLHKYWSSDETSPSAELRLLLVK